MLKFSSVLTNADLIEIVRSQGVEKQRAIAGPASVSGQLSDALIDTRKENVVDELVANDCAEISDLAMHRLLDAFGRSCLTRYSRPSMPP